MHISPPSIAAAAAASAVALLHDPCVFLPARRRAAPTFPHSPLALEWGRRILEEFRLQAALEASAGLPVTAVASGDIETTMKGQHFFAAKVGVGAGVRVVSGGLVLSLMPGDGFARLVGFDTA